MPEQLPLFRPRSDASFANFVVTAGNAPAIHALQAWLAQPGAGIFCLFGGPGSGRSHLLQAACRDREAIFLPLAEVSDADPAAVCDQLDRAGLVCFDDLDRVLADPGWCEALFHLCNRLQAGAGKLLFSAAAAATALDCALPDLRSRLAWGGSFRLQPLDEDGLARALKARAAERGFALEDGVVAYILGRHARDIRALLTLLQTLDQHSLAEHKRITIPFVRRFLD